MARRGFSATSGSERLGRLAIIGVILVPLLIGGILAWALATPVANLDRVTAAIVNDDVPVTVNGQTVPLGRQFAAGLMAGGSDASAPPTQSPSATPSPTDATGTATPAPTTAGDGEAAEASTDEPTFDWVLTNADEAAAGLATGRYVAVVTIPSTFSAAATSFGGPSADARQAAIEVATTPASAWLDPALTKVITQGATEALNRQLTEQYLGQVYSGFNTINEQIGEAADGAEQLAEATDELVAGLATLVAGADSLAAGLVDLDAAAQPLPAETADLAAGADAVAVALGEASGQLDQAVTSFAAVVAQLCQTPGPLCTQAGTALTKLEGAEDKVDRLAGGADLVADGNDALAAAMPPLVAGIDDAAAGSSDVAEGVAQVSAGVGEVDDGANELASGLESAVEQIPTYSDSDIATLSSVVSQPVLVDQAAIAPGLQSVPLFAMLALWVGGIVIALALQPVPTRRLLTSAGSAAIAGRAVVPAVEFGAAQGVVVAVVVLGSVAVTPVEWLAFTAGAVVVGAVFAMANMGLAAAFGGPGRVVAVVIALVALAAGLSSTVPPVVESIAATIPTAYGWRLLIHALTLNAIEAWTAVAMLAVVAVVAFGLVFAGVAARRKSVTPNGAAQTQ